MKGLLGYWAIKERRVLSQTLDLIDRVVTANVLNKLSILGEELDLTEAEVVDSDEQGRIVEYKLYGDLSPIMAILRKSKSAE